ncbi:MAG: 16S rRNA (guanine(527)-N(7))-methyltransferase RsmG [Geminicoccaceae bacterium]|nr:MAG: 16S rRNA (guanine(527)-N(7))-methyltransferase RsmG [Geminicoccaceae bacterium]
MALDAATLARLDAYAALLTKWQAKLNLVGPKTLPDLWQRHVLDSGQLFRHLPPGARTLVDMGSGAGFPGLVLAIMGVPSVTLIEADRRKAIFLREAARAAEVALEVRAERLEQTAKAPVDVVTARALAPVADLLGWAEGFLGPATTCLFLKGATVEDELTAARADWMMNVKSSPSLTHPEGVILELTHVRRG